MRELTRGDPLMMERFCFDHPRELFPCHHQPGLKEGYGRFSGWMSGDIFKRSGNHKAYNPLSSCFPLHKPNFCFLPFEKSLCGGVTGHMAMWIDKCTEEQISFYSSTYHDSYVPENILRELCMEAAVNYANKKGIYSSRNCLGLRSCDHHAALGVVYYPSGADMQQITVGLLLNNASLSMQTDVVDSDHSFTQYSRTHAMHCVQDVEWYKMPSAVSEISVTSCQGKDFLGIRSHYHCAVFTDSITSKIHDYVQHYENFINQGLQMDNCDFSQFESLEHLGVTKCTKPISAFCMNSQFVGELLLITNDGTLNLWKLDSDVVQPHTNLAVSSHNHWWDCCYGAHPCHVVIANSSTVNLLDLRAQNHHLMPLYSSDHYSIKAISQHPIHPYHNIITTLQCVQVMDIRRPLQPLLTVHLDDYSSPHSPSVPSEFIDVVTTDALDTLVLVPSHHQQLLLQYSGGYVKWDGKSERPAVPTPHLTMNPHSILHYNSLLTDGSANATSYRLTSPLIGSRIIQSSESLMGIVQLSQVGDLFYHQWNYIDNTEHSRSIKLPLVDKTLWMLWQQEVSLQEEQCLPYQEVPLTSSHPIDLAPISKYVIGSGDNMDCLLCHTYRATISDASGDKTATANTCILCGCKLSTVKTGDHATAGSGARLLKQSFDLNSLPPNEYELVHNLWKLWGQDEQPSALNQEQLVSSPSQEQVAPLSTKRWKRTKSFSTKKIGF